MTPMTVNAWACHMLASLWFLGVIGIIITGILSYQILSDCKKREARRKRQKELQNGREHCSAASG